MLKTLATGMLHSHNFKTDPMLCCAKIQQLEKNSYCKACRLCESFKKMPKENLAPRVCIFEILLLEKIIFKNFAKKKAEYKECNEEPISIKVKKNKWKLFGHILCLLEDIQANLCNEILLLKATKCKEIPWKSEKTLPISIDQDIKNALKQDQSLKIKQFSTMNDL